MASTIITSTVYASYATLLAICSLGRWFQWWNPQVSIFFETKVIRQILSQQKRGFSFISQQKLRFWKASCGQRLRRRTLILVSNERAQRVLYDSLEKFHAGSHCLGEKLLENQKVFKVFSLISTYGKWWKSLPILFLMRAINICYLDTSGRIFLWGF